jgi:hypothetical protein
MYDKSDPRAALAPAGNSSPAVPPGGYAPPSYVKFYETVPQKDGSEGQTWYARGQTFVIA